jgi:hypothetical protein
MSYHCRICNLVFSELPPDAVLLPAKSKFGYALYRFGGVHGVVHDLKVVELPQPLHVVEEPICEIVNENVAIPVVEEVTPTYTPPLVAEVKPKVLGAWKKKVRKRNEQGKATLGDLKDMFLALEGEKEQKS